MLENQGSTILIVEDIDEISSHMQAALTARGHRLLTANNDKEAIRIAERDRPILILTDVDLPTFGLLIESIQHHSVLYKVPIVVIDLNHASLGDLKVEVVKDFEQLDELIRAYTSCD